MSFSPLKRRTLLGSGATVSCLAFIGLEIEPTSATSPAGSSPLTGVLVGWLVIAPDGGGQITLLQVDAESRPVRQIAVGAIQPTTSIAGAARQASTAVLRFAATSWQVLDTDCNCGWGRIEHRQSGRSIPFAIWTDFALI
jgi:hypothetical protein